MAFNTGTPASSEEIRYVFYGINRKTLEVEAVGLTSDGRLCVSRDGIRITHEVQPGHSAKEEVAMVFGLSDVFMLPATLDDGEHYTVAALRDKVAEMRAEKAPIKGCLEGAATVFYWPDLEQTSFQPESFHCSDLHGALKWVMEKASLEARANAYIRIEGDERVIRHDEIVELYRALPPA